MWRPLNQVSVLELHVLRIGNISLELWKVRLYTWQETCDCKSYAVICVSRWVWQQGVAASLHDFDPVQAGFLLTVQSWGDHRGERVKASKIEHSPRSNPCKIPIENAKSITSFDKSIKSSALGTKLRFRGGGSGGQPGPVWVGGPVGSSTQTGDERPVCSRLPHHVGSGQAQVVPSRFLKRTFPT